MKKPVVTGLAIIVLAVVVVGGYWWYQSRQDSSLTLYSNMDIHTTSLSLHVGGRVEPLAVNEGDVIRAGQVLDELNHRPYETALMQAKAGISAAQTQYGLMFAGYHDEEVAQAAAAVKQAQAAHGYTQNFYNHQQGLWKSRITSASDLENACSSRGQAQATPKSAQDKLRWYRSSNREQDIAQAKTSLEQAQVQLAQVELNLQDSTLVTPSDGTLLACAVEPGTVFNGGGTVLTVSLTRPVWVRAYVDERNFDRIQPGHKVLFYTDGRSSEPYHGQIGLVSPTAEFTPKAVEALDLCTDLVCRLHIVVADVDNALRQGMPITVQFGDKAGHE